MSASQTAPQPVDIGSRLELLIDEFLIESRRGDIRLELHQPVRRELAFETDAPWEGNACGYPSIVRVQSGWRIYYHGMHYLHSGPAAQDLPDHARTLCFVESDDGIHWHRPELGLCEFDGSTANNIVLLPETVAQVEGCPAHTAVFRDENPDCPPEKRYKVVMRGKHNGDAVLYLLQSPDGVRLSLASPDPIVTHGAFDSQNLMFWDPVRGEYREYHRHFKAGTRDIMTAVSADPLRFPDPEWLAYPGSPRQQLYTNQIVPYYRAPHIFMGFPARYTEREWSGPLFEAPDLEERLARARSHERFGTAVTDALFMTSRDGLTYKRWDEAFIRPGPRRRDSWVYGDNYMFWGMIETPSATEDAPPEISMYAAEGYWEGISNSFRRYTIRQDGFVSARAPLAGGELLTRPIVFDGGNLTLNLETSGPGGVQVELQHPDGVPILGYTLADCPSIFCDSVSRVVRWRGRGGDVRPLAGQPVRLRFVLRDADLYAFQFAPYTPDPARPDLSGIELPE